MKLYLASLSGSRACLETLAKEGIRIPYVLESFYYMEDWIMDYVAHCQDFILDSGAYSFLKQNKSLCFDDYLKRYIAFINQHDVKQFLELDVDAVVGLKKVEEYRHILERETGKKCIPVWHRSRGKPYFLDLVQEYNTVGFGGIALRHVRKKEFPYLLWFLEQAHQHQAELHALGFSDFRHLKWLRFDRVDCTTWWSGGRYGILHRFDGQRIRTVSSGRRLNHQQANLHNTKEWIKYVHYLQSL